MTIATRPIRIPEICVLLSFSLNKSAPAKVVMITIPPFATGKNTALGITAESETLRRIYMQPVIPESNT